MNRRELEEHLREHGCELVRHGAKHDIWTNTATGTTAAVPQHKTVKKSTARGICRELEIELPGGL